jgi:heptosyltransferase-1
MPTRTCPLAELEPRRVALLKPSALGDIIHALPVLTALRRRYPSAHLTWVVNRNYEPLLQGHPHLDATLPVDRGAFSPPYRLLHGARTVLRLARRLRRGEFDLVLDLQGLLRTGLMAGCTGAPRRVGLAGAREGASWFYTDVVPLPARPLHAVDRYWLVAEALGAGEGPPEFHVPVSEEARRWAWEQLHDCPRPWLAVGPGARWVTKRWPAGHFAELAFRAQAHFGGTVFLIGGRDESAAAGSIHARLAGPVRDFTARTSLPQLAALLERADVMLAGDTGPLHLAVALGRPVVAPYTCTRTALTGPYGSQGSAVETTVWCGGSCRKRCPRMECMAELTPDRLWPVLCEVLLSWETPAVRCA